MNPVFSLNRTAKFFLLLSFLIFTVIACQKEVSNSGGGGATPPDLTTKVSSSVSGFVTDENNAAVKNATVQVGASVITTDKYGFFEALNVSVVKDAATVTVTKAGYFKGIKTYIATAGKSAFFRIKLIPKTNSGNVNATAGGTVALPNGLSVGLPAGAVINAATNVAYNGTVNIAAYWINPTSTDISAIMPGDLRGVNTDGNLKRLTSYGMAAVELTGSGGELLQIAAGKKASVSFPIPVAIASTAPVTIPLWSFDEAKGLWKEEGSATKSGSNYVGEVSHFSFWNCDVPNNYVQFNCTIKGTDGLPIPFALVKISLVSNPFVAAYGYTDSAGYVAGAVPDNAQLLLEVFGDFNCSTPAYTQTFTTTNTNISLGTITVSINTALANITGTVTNCANSPVTDGYIIAQSGTVFQRHDLTNTGTYSFNMLLCSAAGSVTIIGEDVTNAQQSNPSTHAIVAGNNTIPNIQACGVSTQQFINYTINGTPYNFTMPADSISCSGNNGTSLLYIYGNRNPANANFVNFTFSGTNIAAGSTQGLGVFMSNQITGNAAMNGSPVVNITEYGTFGQFVAGDFIGSCTGPAPANTVYNFTCNFRVRKYF